MSKKQKIHLNYKVVPFTFNILFTDVNEVLGKLGGTSDIYFETSTEKPFIGKIETYFYDKKEEKIFVLIRGDYENNKDKKIIDNAKKQFDGKIGSDKTVTNEYIFIFDFGSCIDGELYTEKDTQIKKGFLYAYYEGSYHIVRTLTQYFEEELLSKLIVNVGNYTTRDKPLGEVKDFLSKLETNVVMSNGDGKQRKIGTFLISPKSLFLTTERNTKIDGVEYSAKFILDALSNIETTLKGFSEGIKRNFPSINYEFISSAWVKGKKRLFVLDDKSKSYIIKSFPDEEKLSEDGQKLVHDILQKQLSEAEDRTKLTEEGKTLVERIFSGVNLFKINKSRKVED